MRAAAVNQDASREYPLLAGVTYPGAAPQPHVQYLYEDTRFPYVLTGIIDENGNRAASWTYDNARRVATNERGGGADLVTFGPYNYNVDSSNWITNALGEQFAYYFISNHGKLKLRALGQAVNGTVAGVASWVSYDPNGYVASRTDRNGIVTTYVNDARGMVLSKTEASGTAQARTASTTGDHRTAARRHVCETIPRCGCRRQSLSHEAPPRTYGTSCNPSSTAATSARMNGGRHNL